MMVRCPLDLVTPEALLAMQNLLQARQHAHDVATVSELVAVLRKHQEFERWFYRKSLDEQEAIFEELIAVLQRHDTPRSRPTAHNREACLGQGMERRLCLLWR